VALECLLSNFILGIVVVQSADGREKNAWDFKRPLRAVALEPEYGQLSTRRFVSGGSAGELVISEKGWLGKKETIASSDQGVILAIIWRHDLIGWTSEMVISRSLYEDVDCIQGLGVYSTATSQIIFSSEREKDALRPDLNPSLLCWKDNTTLLCGWDDTVTLYNVKVWSSLFTCFLIVV
jgi:hypothetical protein